MLFGTAGLFRITPVVLSSAICKRAEARIAGLIASDPARAVRLYETLLAECDAKAEEIDDSDGEFGTFAGGLFCCWIQARQAAGADRTGTAKGLLGWIDDDSYGFCNDLAPSAVTVHLFSARRHRKVYRSDCEGRSRSGRLRGHCHDVPGPRKLNDALAWVERGLGIGDGGRLGEMQRALPAKLGRGSEALDSAWAEFQKDPGEDTYHELFRYVPKAGRAAWHERAMGLGSLIELWLGAKETMRLAERLDRASDAGKSNYCYAALSNLEKAKDCYRNAGLDARWKVLVDEIRREHHRKFGFMPGFERIIRGTR